MIAITHLVTRNALCVQSTNPHKYRNVVSSDADLCSFLLPKNLHLGEAAAVGGWEGGAWELELNYMFVRGVTFEDCRCASHAIRWGRPVALSVYTGELAARDEEQQELLLRL
jgi:hypothetical protein